MKPCAHADGRQRGSESQQHLATDERTSCVGVRAPSSSSAMAASLRRCRQAKKRPAPKQTIGRTRLKVISRMTMPSSETLASTPWYARRRRIALTVHAMDAATLRALEAPSK
eukprot:scaffold103776_cov27-Tisochrysis_lutea.AAC.5